MNEISDYECIRYMLLYVLSLFYSLWISLYITPLNVSLPQNQLHKTHVTAYSTINKNAYYIGLVLITLYNINYNQPRTEVLIFAINKIIFCSAPATKIL